MSRTILSGLLRLLLPAPDFRTLQLPRPPGTRNNPDAP